MQDDRDDSLEKRRRQLEADLAARGQAGTTNRGQSEESRKGYKLAIKLSSEFVSAVIVGALLGLGIDWLAGTTPWAMVIFLMLGFVAGVMNVMRSTGAVKSPHPADRLGEMNRKSKEK